MQARARKAREEEGTLSKELHGAFYGQALWVVNAEGGRLGHTPTVNDLRPKNQPPAAINGSGWPPWTRFALLDTYSTYIRCNILVGYLASK